MKNQRGNSLLELALYIALLTIIVTLAAPPFAWARDVLAVRAARDAVVAASARARSHAVSHGGASLRIDTSAGTLRITTQDQAVSDLVDLASASGVRIRLENTQATVATLPYDALGIGRLANRTITISRGRVTGGVTFSAYGRARPW
ncbi:MAG TPA: hypothetical protein VF035_02550 [Longimicrobiales bacterium]